MTTVFMLMPRKSRSVGNAIVGPPLVGFVAQGAGLRAGLAAILPLMLLSALFAGSLKRRET